MTMTDMLFILIKVFLVSAAYGCIVWYAFTCSLMYDFKRFRTINRLNLTLEEYRCAAVNLVAQHSLLHDDDEEYGEYYGMMIDKVETLATIGQMQAHVEDLLELEKGKETWLKRQGEKE